MRPSCPNHRRFAAIIFGFCVVCFFGNAGRTVVAQEFVPQISPGQFPIDSGFPSGQVIQDQLVPGQVIGGQVIGGQVIEGQVIEGQIVEGQLLPPGGQIVQPGKVIDPQGVPSTSVPNRSPMPPSETLQNSSPSGGTAIAVATELVRLLSRGGIPGSIESLRQLEVQQRKVAAVAASCTVSVEIGPAQGCGVIVSDSGYILTAAHVAMRPNKQAWVTLSDGRRVRAKTLGMNRNVDAGLMKIDSGQNGGKPWPRATLGTSKNLVPGMWCIATGHPGGYDHRRGAVTRIGRILEVRKKALVTDCALIGGDSGGPLFDISGRLIAVHSRIGNDVAENLHVPIDHYDVSWDRMQAGTAWGYLEGFRPVLGISGSKTARRALVDAVGSGSPAEKAGIKVNDVIEQFGDIAISDFESLKSAVANTMPGERLPIWVNRDGVRRRFRIEVGRAD